MAIMLETKPAILPVDLNHRSVTWCFSLWVNYLISQLLCSFFYKIGVFDDLIV